MQHILHIFGKTMGNYLFTDMFQTRAEDWCAIKELYLHAMVIFQE